MKIGKKIIALGSFAYLSLDCLLIATDTYDLLQGVFG